MAVRLDSLVSAIAHEAGLDPDRVSQDKTNIIRWINDARREIYELPVHFSAMEFVGEFVGVANVTAGTVAATQNQPEVTGTSTSFTTAMAGRYISINSAAWQRIAYVSDTTHLTLESSWNEGSVTGKTYIIWKRDYQLPPKVAKIKRLFDLNERDKPLSLYDPAEFYQRFGFGDTFSPAYAWMQYGQSDIADAFLGKTIYTSVTVTAGSPLVDLASVNIVTAIAPGDRLIIGNATTSTAFFVDRILTDTRLALTHVCTISTGTTSATAESLNRLNIRFYPSVDSSRVYYFEAYKNLRDLSDNSDLIEPGWYNAVRKGAIAKAMGYITSPREGMKIKEYEFEVANLIRTQYKALNPAIRMKVHIPQRYGLQGRFPSDRDEP